MATNDQSESVNVTRTNRILFHEQKKVEKLLLKLAKMKPISAKPTPVANGQVTQRTA